MVHLFTFQLLHLNRILQYLDFKCGKKKKNVPKQTFPQNIKGDGDDKIEIQAWKKQVNTGKF